MPESPAKLDLSSMDIAADKRQLLRQLFPEVFTESSDAQGNPAELDFEKLKAVLGEHSSLAAPGAETYGLDWPGKRDALKAVQTPALGTLLPCPEESVDWENTKNGSLLLCLANRIDNALIDAVTECRPAQFICLDRALHGDDALKVNALETFRACQPEIQFRTV